MSKRKFEEEVDAAPLSVEKRQRQEESPPDYQEAIVDKQDENTKYLAALFMIEKGTEFQVSIRHALNEKLHETKDNALTVMIAIYANEVQRLCPFPNPSYSELFKPYSSHMNIATESMTLDVLSEHKARQLVSELNKQLNGELGGTFTVIQIKGDSVVSSFITIDAFGNGMPWNTLKRVVI